MTATRTAPEQRPDAVVWIDERRAIVAQTAPDGIATVEIRRATEPETRFLGRVVHELGSSEHVMIVGPADVRLALERRYVSISHRPDRLIAAPVGARIAGAQVIDRFERLAA